MFGPGHNPAWRLSPSNDAVRALLSLLRQTGPDGALRHRFEGTDTRFLGDLYQDLSESVRERYALLQTPAFVERFILAETLDPAIKEFGLDRVRVLDPTCGSGHFLLGAFERLLDRRMHEQPGVDRREHARAALAQVYGVDVNPYAAAIARFRLTLAYLAAAEIDTLSRAPRIETNLVVADSLLHETGQTRLSDHSDDRAAWGDQMFALDDPEAAKRILGQRYHVVVGNPPYITCKDSVLRDEYRNYYEACYREYRLTAPFTERFFQLAEERGFIGMINGNGFMKREFGKVLIEKVLPRYELTRIVDASGARIPGHDGTPTVILFGRKQAPVLASVRAVLGKRGEPGTPENAEHGLVWSSIAAHYDEPLFENEYISVADMPRETFNRHPWSLGGGGTLELKESLEERSTITLGSQVESIGFACITKQDDVFLQPRAVLTRWRVEAEFTRRFVVGQEVRDWSVSDGDWAIFPYTREIRTVDLYSIPAAIRFMWPYRTMLNDRKVFGGKSYKGAEKPWYEYGQIPADRFSTPLSIAFAFVATHNHFVLDRGGKVFNRTAPIIKLPVSATEDEHLTLLAYLNSSTACFWYRQMFAPKGMHNGSEANATPFLVRFEFDGTKLAKLPLPNGLLGSHRPRLMALAQAIDAQQFTRANLNFGSIADRASTRADLEQRIAELLTLRTKALHLSIALQEELDWLVYGAFGLVDNAMAASPEEVEPLVLGERPFEIRLARTDPRSVTDGWFRWNETEPCAETPARFSAAARARWEQRLQLLDKVRELQLLEVPECKRRWVQPSGKAAQELQTDAKTLRDQAVVWVADRIETLMKDNESICTVRALLTRAKQDAALMAAAEWLASSEREAEDVLREAIEENAVPFLGAFRYSESGLDVWSQWLEVWDLQRREDAGESVAIKVPPKYEQKDYRGQTYWRLRGKLDVPKERFISYPGAEGDDDRSPLVGWAGWDHLQRAQALAALLQQRKDHDGWEPERLAPLLAGLDELVPWLKQWHNEPDSAFDNQRMGDLFEDFVRAQARGLGLTLDELRAWRPERKQGRRSAAARTATKKTSKRAGKSSGAASTKASEET